MPSVNELYVAGFKRIKLPNWAVGFAHLVELENGNLSNYHFLYDVNNGLGGGEPIMVSLRELNLYNTWEGVDANA